MASHLRTKMVRVKIEEGTPGLFVATSPDLQGLLVAEHSLEALHNAIPTAVRELLAAYGERVVVTRLDDDMDGGYEPWVATPEQALRLAAN
jgi:hypothetical protein